MIHINHKQLITEIIDAGMQLQDFARALGVERSAGYQLITRIKSGRSVRVKTYHGIITVLGIEQKSEREDRLLGRKIKDWIPMKDLSA